MKKRAYTKKSAGFTIVEVMVVLAVTGVLVLSAFSIIRGRTRHVSFQQAVNDLAGRITRTINEVQVGYNGFENISCEKNAAGVKEIQVAPDSTTGVDGSADCIFIGKIIQFNADGVADNMRTISVVGNRLYTTSVSTQAFARAAVNLEEADPVLVNPSNGAPGLYNAVTRTPWGIELQKDALAPTAFLIMQSLAPEGTSFVLNNRYATAEDIGIGAQNLYIAPLDTSKFDSSNLDALAENLKRYAEGKETPLPLKAPLKLCFADPLRENQFARIYIGPQSGDVADPSATFTGYGVTTEYAQSCA